MADQKQRENAQKAIPVDESINTDKIDHEPTTKAAAGFCPKADRI